MACGLKKQNNQEGGVHLTERTCSPYNPIIKLMVDDCLGLPIYPVSSIDAVIDEDGNTLRKLLDELVNLINGGQSNLTEIIRQIQLAITTIEGNYLTEEDLSDYVTKDSLNSLKSLLWAISALTNINSVNENTDLYESDRVTPKIVAAINKLRKDINDIIGGGDGVSLDSLNEAIEALSRLLLAVANFDTATHNEEGLTHYADNLLIKIIKRILDIEDDLLTIKESLLNSEDPDSIISQINSLWERIGELQGQIDDLIRDKETFASLDEYVTRQCPEGVSEYVKNRYKVLRFSQYPPTSAYFVRNDGGIPENLVNRLLYFGLFNPVNAGETLNYYPFGHIDESKGWPLEYKLPNDTEYHPLMSGTEYPTQLRAGDSTLSGEDLMLICHIIQDRIPNYEVSLAEEMPSDLKYSNLYINLGNNNHVLVGTVNLDNEVNVADVLATIDAMLHQTIAIPSLTLPGSSYAANWMMFTANDQTTILFPCIEGKLYSDISTGTLYRYSIANIEGVPNMIPVSHMGLEVVEGETGPIVNEEIKYLYNDLNLGPYKKYTITIPKQTEYTAGAGISIEEGENRTATIKTNTTSFPTLNILEPLSDNDLYKLSIEGHQLNLNVVPTIMYLKPEPEPDPNPLIQSSESSIHPIEGQYYVTIDQQRIKVLPDELDDRTEYNVEDLSVLIDRLLNGVTYTTAQLDILDTLLYNVLERFNLFNDSQLDLLTTIKESIQETLPEILLLSPVDRVFTYYIEDDDNPHQAFGTYADAADNGTYDFDGDNTVGVSDVTSFIDDLMQGNDLSIRYNQRLVGATLYQYKNGDYVLIGVVPLDKENYETQSLRGVIFLLMDQYNEEAWTWYYFDEEGSFIPMFPDLHMEYDSSESKLKLGTLKKQLAQCTLPINSKDNSSPNPSPGNANDISPIKVHSTNFLGASESSQLLFSHTMLLPELDLPVFHPTTLREDTLAGQVQVEAIAHLNYNVAEYDGSQTQSNLDFIDLINQTKSARYYKCFDLMSQELIYALEIISFEVIDPNEAEEDDIVVTVGDNVTVKVITEVETIKRFYIQDNVLYNIPQYGLTVKFTHENNSLIPIIVSVEHRKAPESRITDTAAKTTAVVYPNEFLEIYTITSDKLTFDVSHLTLAIEPDLIPVRGTFVGKANLEISFYEPDNLYVITSLSPNPTIENGKTYGYEIFNRTFKIWEL